MKPRAEHLFVAPALLALATLNLQLSTAFAQGSLTPPPGAPAPTMLTLNQIEPRTPISSAPYGITKPGSYYLTTNLIVTVGDAIDISANGVTLDLNGFTVSSSSPFDSGTAIYLFGNEGGGIVGNTDISISNGHIACGVTNKAGVYEGPGFNSGISSNPTGGTPYNVRVTGVTVSGCLTYGINVGTGNSSVVESCTVNTVGGYGIVASGVSHSTAYQCGSTAITADTASDCYGYCTGSGDGLYVTYAANNCYGQCSGNLVAGISVQGNAINCYGNSSGFGDGLFAGNSAENCYGTSSSGFGIRVYVGNASNCHGISASSTGLFAGANAINCYGSSGGAGDGLDASAANNCYGYSIGAGNGLNVFQSASGCYGYSGGNGNGLQAGVANTCSGYANGSGSGISASSAFNCNGSSTNGVGLYVTNNAENCTGTCISQTGLGNGLYAGANANNCNGYCNTGLGYGLSAINANNCYGYSLAGTGIVAANAATGCDGVSGSGIGLSAVIAIGCISSSGDGHINNKYNMP